MAGKTVKKARPASMQEAPWNIRRFPVGLRRNFSVYSKFDGKTIQTALAEAVKDWLAKRNAFVCSACGSGKTRGPVHLPPHRRKKGDFVRECGDCKHDNFGFFLK